MELYLVQHGEAAPEQVDPARPLTDRGRAEVERVAGAAARLGLSVPLIRHSGKLRARQTAEILARHLAPGRGTEERAGLHPNDDPALVARDLERGGEPCLLVGHLPHLARLASLLLLGEPDRPIIAFRMGGLVHLRRGPEGWRLVWILTPETVT